VSGQRLAFPTGRLRLAAWWSLLVCVGIAGMLLTRTPAADSGRQVDDRDQPPSTSAPAAVAGEADEADVDDPAPALTDEPSPSAGAPARSDVGTDPPSDPRLIDPEYDDTTPNTFTTVPPADGCDPGYAGACIPLPPARVTCADIPERGIIVTGADLQGLDDDFDGTACPPEQIFVEADHPDEPLD